MRYTVIENASNKVVNVVEADAPYEITDHIMVASETANIGDTYDGSNFIPPPPPPPAMNEATLYEAISEVCPIYSVTIGDGTDRSTWSYDPKPEASPTQIAAADNVVATIPIKPQTLIATTDFIARWTNAEYLALEKKRRDDITANKVGNAKNWDILISADAIKLDRKKAQTLKADLVSSGVLTQVRADEIFS